MAQKRRAEDLAVDLEKQMESLFQTTATSISQLYLQSCYQKKIAFDAGKKQALEKLYEWIQLQLQDGKTVTLDEISAYLQNELTTNSHNTQLLEQSVGESHESGASQGMNGNASTSQDQKMSDV